ncbi:MAG: hypothetical protein JXR50_07495 [Prolixibacteraceae bacterium]|nr:hypothetical protein [Prolixibacteraceae bacterium]MBN2649568.1 hypothetical protein [Prolixibacteraceae bacterium]
MRAIGKILMCLFIFVVSTTTQAQENKNILLLNSYHYGFRWSDEITDGIKDAIEEIQNTTLFVGYLDAKRNPNFYDTNIFKDAFRRKYQDKQFDIVIVSDNAAFDFLMVNHDMPCWENATYIATGISNYKSVIDTDNLYIVPEISTFDKTFKNIFSFFPETNELVFITDTLQTGKIYINEVREILNNKHPGVKLTVLHDFTLQTLPNIIKSYKKNTVIYVSTVAIDQHGKPVNDYEVARIVAENSNVPVFSGLYGEKYERFVGGSYILGVEIGQTAGNMALSLIENKNDLPQVVYPPVKTIFNYPVLKKYNIPSSLIPDYASIKHKPESFLAKNKNVVLISGLIIINLLIIISLLTSLWLSQKKHKTQLLKAVSQAEEANKLKTIFLENVSHEMRTPLNSIIGFSDVLSEIITKKTEKEYLKIISDNALDLYHLISNIFSFSLLKSHKVTLEYSEVNPAGMILEIINESHLRTKAELGTVNLKLDFDEQLETKIITDREKLFQVLKHIIFNAFKFTHEGEITIKFRLSNNSRTEFNSQNNETPAKPTYILFMIKDTGVGITKEEQEFIFEPFRQANENTTDANRGLGLGLSISRSIIEIMGGTLRLKSKPGKGTTFYFSIPVKDVRSEISAYS